MTRRPHLRRFTDTIIRLRPRVVGFDEYGEWEESGIDRDALPASVQPVGTEDRDGEGGPIRSQKMIVFVPVGLRRAAGVSEALTWAGSTLLWGGAPLTWSGQAGVEEDNELPLQTSPADNVVFAGDTYVVVGARTWPGSHCRTEILFEN